MFGHTFKGGIHPYDGKELSKDKAISSILPKGDLVYPLSQHIGAPAVPIVEKGEHVLVGQKIAEAGGFVSAPIHASVSGTVKGVEKHLTVTGNLADCIVIENDGKYEEIVWPERKPLEQMTPKEILEIVKEAGIVGMGGAGFPTHVKLSPKEPEKIDYVIANCAECEPYLTSDYRRMIENPELLVGGMKVFLQIFPQAKGVIAVEDNKKDAIEYLEEAAKDSNIQVVPLKTKYPQGAERMLIYAVTGRKLNSSMLPADLGCVVDNCDTVVSLYRAVVQGRPLMHRIVTVTGDAVQDPRNFSVCTGTCYRELLEAAGGLTTKPEKIISGGPMMGFGLYSLDVPVTKTSSALLCMTKDEVSRYEETACINCGRCVEACPEQLIPSRLAKFSNNGLAEAFESWHGLECVECGSCSFVCPARRQLAQSIKTMKKQVLAAKRKK